MEENALQIKGRDRSMDVIRAFAIVLMVYGHFGGLRMGWALGHQEMFHNTFWYSLPIEWLTLSMCLCIGLPMLWYVVWTWVKKQVVNKASLILQRD